MLNYKIGSLAFKNWYYLCLKTSFIRILFLASDSSSGSADSSASSTVRKDDTGDKDDKDEDEQQDKDEEKKPKIGEVMIEI